MELIADRYEQETASPSIGRVLHPARDRLSGATVSVLRVPAPEDAAELAEEVDRLRRLARMLHPHLVEVRAVEARAGLLYVVCEPLRGELLSSAQLDLPLTVHAVQRLAEDVLEALAALHRCGVVHGAVSGHTLLLSHRTGTSTEVDVTLLPVPSVPDRPGGEQFVLPTGRSGRAGGTPADDVRAAATTLLGLLDRTPKGGLEASVLAAGLTRALTRAGGVESNQGSAGTDGPGTSARSSQVDDPRDTATPLGGEPSGSSGGRRAAAAAPPRGSAPFRERSAAARSGRRRRAGVGAAVLGATAVGVAAALVWAGRDTGLPSGAQPAGGDPAAVQVTSAPSPPAQVPQTLPELVADLTARPDAAGPAGPALRDGLSGLMSGDETVRQQAALQVLSLLVDGHGLDPRYATASRLVLLGAMTGSMDGTPVLGGPPSCVEAVEGVPAPLVQGYAQRVLDRLPAWQVDGFPADATERVRQMVAPVAAGDASLGLRPCPVG